MPPNWSTVYFEHLAAATPNPERSQRFDRELASAIAKGRQACSGCNVDDGGFVRHLATHLGQRIDDPAWLDQVRVDDLMLAYACGHGCGIAAKILRSKVDATIEAAAQKVDSSQAFVDEVRQRVFEKILVAEIGKPRRILAYAGIGPLEAWIRIAAVRVAIDILRQRRGAHDSADALLEELDAASTDPELAYMRLRYAGEVNAAIQHAFAALSPRERTILRLHLLDGLNIDRIGVLYQVHRATVARWIAKARETIVIESHNTLRTRLGATDSEVESLERLVRSDLHICLSDVLVSSSRHGS